MRVWGIVFCLLLTTCGGEPGKPVAVDDESDQFFTREGDYAASHILVSFKGARNADAAVKRSVDEASAKAQDLLAKVKANPSQFADLARAESDGGSAALDGSLGAWKSGEFVPELERAVATLAEGAFLDYPLRSEFGFHVLRRDPLRAKHYCADGFVISFGPQPDHPELPKRSRQEAQTLAAQIQKELSATTFDALAARYNDLGEGASFMGVVCDGVLWPTPVMELLQRLRYGEVGGPVELPMGFAFLRREKVVAYAGSAILVTWQGAVGAKPNITRTKNQAHQRATALIADLKNKPDAFVEYAHKESDSPTATDDGDLKWFRGTMDGDFRAGFERLELGQISKEPVETRFGYYIILRKAPSG